MTENELSILTESGVFKGLEAEKIKPLLNDYTLKKICCKKGELIAFQGDAYKDLLIVLEGTVSSDLSDPGCKRVKLKNFNNSAAIAPGVLFARDKILPVTLTAVTDCTLLCIPKEKMLSILQSDRICLENYLALLGNKVNILADKIRLFKFSSI